LYAHGAGEVTLDAVMAVVADASELKLDPIVDAAFAGNAAVVETEFAKAMVAGTYPGVIISAAQRQAAWLHKSALAIAEGTPASSVLEGGYPRLHFSRKSAVEIALRNFSPVRLVMVIDQLATAALDMGSLGFPRTTKKISSAASGQSPHHLVELLQAAVADQHAAAGVAMIDGHAESERVADAFLQRNGVGVLGLAGACPPRLLRLAL